ncbi:MAG: carboxylating nicotinate-nucleotide diphosphorylase [Chthonomonadaceae bacterium]|nr:carboxylating nicotinate-nucleotide diphosphorylase [Chthonomonadaceae bacterium]
MNGWHQPAPEGWIAKVEEALLEDIGPGDLSAGSLPPDSTVDWYIEAQGAGVLCGVEIAAYTLQNADVLVCDGSDVAPKTRVLQGQGLAHQVLQRERAALNFLMHLSGVASLTKKFVDQIAGFGAMIVDTRKTTPGLRGLEKYAVRCGGGRNHRLGLFDGVMVKDNHIRAAGSINKAVAKVRGQLGHMTKIEVECENLEQVREAVDAGVDVVMLDNMELSRMSAIVNEFGGRTVLEASGGVTLDSVRDIAATGVDVVSVGALTHSAPALPFHLELQ